jgi:ferredoxin
MRILIDRDACTGHGRCYALAPDLIEVDDQGYPTVLGEPIDVPADQVEFAEEAEASCPEAAISIIAEA